MPDDFAEIIQHININDPLTEEEYALNQARIDFIQTVEQYKELLAGQKSEDFLVSNEFQDEFGYPNTSKIPNLYAFLWNNNPELFDANNNYWWAKPADEVKYVCSEYYKYLKWIEKEEEEYQEDLKEYEEAMKEWEEEQ